MTGCDITGVILAGGKSTRMGQAKAFLPYNGTTLIEHIISRLTPYCEHVLLNVNQPEAFTHLGLSIITDNKKDCGPIGGIEAVLANLATPYCFVVSCDVPYFSGAVIPLLRAEIKAAHACVPVIKGHYEPLVALYAKTALPAFRSAMQMGKYKVADVLQDLHVQILQEEYFSTRHLLNTFVNVNTKAEYNNVLRGNNNA